MKENFPNVWPALRQFLTERLLESASKPKDPAATKEVADLIKDLGKVALPEPQRENSAPRMPMLNSMLGDNKP